MTGQPVPKKVQAGRRITLDHRTVELLEKRSALFRTMSSLSGRTATVVQNDRIEKINITLAILDELYKHSRSNDIPLVIMLMPEITYLTDSNLALQYREISEAVRDFGEDRRIPYLDIIESFEPIASSKYPDFFLQEHWHHYSEMGNALVAERLHEFLKESVAAYPQ